MRRRVLATVLAVTIAAVVVFGVPLAIVIGRFVDEQAVLRLERQAVLATRNIPNDFRSGADPVELPTNNVDDIVYALYDADGNQITGDGPVTADGLTQRALANEVVDGEVGELLVVAVPVIDDEQVIGALRAAHPTSSIDMRTTRLLVLIGALAVGVIALAGALGYLLAGRISRPIRQLRDATVRLGTGDFAIAVPPSSIPEIADTSAALAATAKRLDDLVAKERSFSTDASHQLRTPLTAMRAALETELAFPRPDPALAIREVLGDIDRLETTVDELLAIARTTKRPGAIDLAPVLLQLDEAWGPRFAAHGRSLTIDAHRYLPQPNAHPTMLRHALDVLVDNALVHGVGDVTVNVSHKAASVVLAVTDEGMGFAPSTEGATPADRSQASPAIDHTVAEDHGRGLGLARRLVAAMHGRLTIAEPGTSSCVTVTLQRSDRA
jgi:signal transduction histidine kinase